MSGKKSDCKAPHFPHHPTPLPRQPTDLEPAEVGFPFWNQCTPTASYSGKEPVLWGPEARKAVSLLESPQHGREGEKSAFPLVIRDKISIPLFDPRPSCRIPQPLFLTPLKSLTYLQPPVYLDLVFISKSCSFKAPRPQASDARPLAGHHTCWLGPLLLALPLQTPVLRTARARRAHLLGGGMRERKLDPSLVFW